VFEAAKKIKTSGAASCGFTSTWLTWIQTENFAAWNNVAYGTHENGLGGNDVKLEFNSPLFVQHFQSIADLAKDGTFRYGGRTSRPSSCSCPANARSSPNPPVAWATSSSLA
jgi:sn-glycerol 3-phosphate transport system substrate-binding protein